jgi:hypothetical protein
VLRFPDSTEIRYLDEPPELGARVRSDTGRDWFVAEVLQSGRNTYTVLCMGRDEFLEEVGTTSSKRRVLAEELVTMARRSVGGDRSGEDQQTDRELRRYLASVVDADGRALEYVIDAASAADAEREAQKGARESGATLKDVRLWEEASAPRRGARSRAEWVQTLFRRRATSH